MKFFDFLSRWLPDIRARVAGVALVIGLALVTLAMCGAAQAAEDQAHYVSAGVVCTEDGAKTLFEVFQDRSEGAVARAVQQIEDQIEDGACERLMFAGYHRIVEIVVGPETDADGNVMYVVRIEGGQYTVAWPGLTSNLPPPPVEHGI
jgi:hypothetical protein